MRSAQGPLVPDLMPALRPFLFRAVGTGGCTECEPHRHAARSIRNEDHAKPKTNCHFGKLLANPLSRECQMAEELGYLLADGGFPVKTSDQTAGVPPGGAALISSTLPLAGLVGKELRH